MFITKKEPETIFNRDPYQINFENLIIPFSSIIEKKKDTDIYNGQEKMAFKDRHPIFRALMKIEFEDAAKSWQK